VKLFQQFKPPT